MSELYLKWMDRLYLLAMGGSGMRAAGHDGGDPDWHLLALCAESR
ncbi:TRAP dicarboxylate transporter, DctQ sununit [Enterobacter cloacae]|uniref:TRAP dicarboxylate transporter, DctQ sununit n=1 Tax=Enterobacter cloacae TaxID=550 RepID=A0A377LR95_ENTCL|nr:TRAP dicarboxylate transporter, DctQ sununit [Enterobacter cloacae]